jgi:uncharacterized protein HemY
MAKVLILAGVVLVILGVLMAWGLPLGRLPGDISVRRGNFSFHFPIVTCIVLSVVLTLLFRFFGR